MAVYDRWWKNERQADGSVKRVHSGDYGCENRWQVRWRDEQEQQRTRSFAKKDGKDPEQHAAAFDAMVKTQLAAGTYVDPAAGEVTFRAYAEQWRTTRTHDLATAERIRSQFANHVYSAEGTPGRTVRKAPALGDHKMRALAKRPSVIQGWISGIPLHPNSAVQLIRDVSQVFTAAADDGIIPRNPLSARSVQRPKTLAREVSAWPVEVIASVADALPARMSAITYLGAACGMRQGELFGAAVEDLDFLRKMMHVDTQIKYIGRCLVFAPVKNRKTRDVPVAAPVVPVLAEHVRMYPPVSVTLPWMTPDGKPVTRRLLFTRPGGLPHHRGSFNSHWRRAWRAAGVAEAEQINGMHVLRHTAASVWLSAGLSLAKVAAYLGDTKEVVLSTYAHFMPADDDRAREIMGTFFGGLQSAPCAADVQSGEA